MHSEFSRAASQSLKGCVNQQPQDNAAFLSQQSQPHSLMKNLASFGPGPFQPLLRLGAYGG